MWLGEMLTLGASCDTTTLAPYLNGKVRLQTYHKGQILAQNGMPIHAVTLLMDGRVEGINYSLQGVPLATTENSPLSIFGLLECLHQEDCHSAYLLARTNCTVVEIEKSYFLESLSQDVVALNLALSYLARFTLEALERKDAVLALTPRQRLEHYLSQSAQSHPLPYQIPMTKEALSHSLHIHIRTLYRLLNQLEQEGLIESQYGKIHIPATSKLAYSK